MYGRVGQESVLPVSEAGLVDLVSATHAVTDEVRLEPTHGRPTSCARLDPLGGEPLVIPGAMNREGAAGIAQLTRRQAIEFMSQFTAGLVRSDGPKRPPRCGRLASPAWRAATL
jgi:hypothetical protein